MSNTPLPKRRGRPRKLDKKTERCTVWLEPATKARLEAEAARLGLTLSAYAAGRLSRPREIYMAAADRGRLDAARFELHKIRACLERICSALECLAALREKVGPLRLDWLREVTEVVRARAAALDGGLYEIRPFRPEGE